MTEETLVGAFCRFRHHFRLLFMVSVLALIVLGAALPAIERGTGTHVITIVQLATFAVIGAVSFAMMVVCGRRAD
ncbi:hypothetical protein HT576_21915 [Haloterrigena sp. SYSU A121-1]|uniref:Uncharacterized protein n=1 Tax=Haloterrigena gelatinilytica TaxID=2741724 RepID=A0A8J8GNZ2_9EURY|nr:hypothetical protein [Haloterrigena gelatinilytica]NUB93638.1 hypothetical protein [Haloterrigena gelatinilytica]